MARASLTRPVGGEGRLGGGMGGKEVVMVRTDDVFLRFCWEVGLGHTQGLKF